MKYVSEYNGRVEWIWNSRDGVTPFCIRDPHAPGDYAMQHDDWGEDAFIPNFIPPVGMRIFISNGDEPYLATCGENTREVFQTLAETNKWEP
jgi:hypothetical protein